MGTIVGGMLILPATPETIAGFMAAAEAAPDELSTIANVMPAPPMPFLAPEHHGSLVVLALLAHVGDLEAGGRAIAPFRALATPLADLVRPMPYPEIYPPDDPDYRPLAVSRTMFMDRVGAGEAAAIVAALEASDAPMRVAQLRALGGAMARVPGDATAFAHRGSRIMVNVAAFHDGTPESRARRLAWVENLSAALRQDDDGAYVNFLADEGEARVRAAYPGATWDRLVAVKRRYDPTNLFHRNQNIPPTATMRRRTRWARRSRGSMTSVPPVASPTSSPRGTVRGERPRPRPRSAAQRHRLRRVPRHGRLVVPPAALRALRPRRLLRLLAVPARQPPCGGRRAPDRPELRARRGLVLGLRRGRTTSTAPSWRRRTRTRSTSRRPGPAGRVPRGWERQLR